MSLNAFVGALRASLTLETGSFIKGTDKAALASRKFDKEVRKMSATMRNLGRTFAGLAGGFSVLKMADMADNWSDLSSRVGLAVGSMDQAAGVMDRLYQVAQRTYSPINQTAESYLAFSTSLKEAGLSVGQSLDFVESFNNALVVSGTKGEQATSVQNALAKAMALGALKGDHLNTVMASGGRFAELLAEHFGTTVSGLREVGKQGKITATVINDVLVKNFQKLQEEAEEMPATIGDGFTRIANAAQHWIGTRDQAFGVSSLIADGLVLFSEYFGAIMTGVAAAAAIIMSGYVPALTVAIAKQMMLIATNPYLALAYGIAAATTALVIWGDQIKINADEMATLNDYAIGAMNVMKAGFTDIAEWIGSKFTSAIDSVGLSFDDIGNLWEVFSGYLKDTINFAIANFASLADTVEFVFSGIPSVIGSVVISVIDSIISGFESMLTWLAQKINSLAAPLNYLATTGIGQRMGISTIQLIDEDINIGRLGNTEWAKGIQHNAEQAGKEYADKIASNYAKDYVGAVGKAWSDAAADVALDREFRNAEQQLANNRTATGGGSIIPDIPGSGSGSGKKSKGGGGGRAKATEAERELKKQKEAYDELVKSVDEAQAAIGKTALQQKIAAEFAKMNTVATLEEVTALVMRREKYEEIQKTIESMRDRFVGVFESIITGAKSAKDAIADMLKSFAGRLANKAGNILFDSLLGSIKIPGFATGVTGFAGGLAMVGERGRELVNLPRGSNVITNENTNKLLNSMGSQSPQIHVSVDEGLKVQLLNDAAKQSANITKAGIQQYSRSGLAADVKRLGGTRTMING